MRNAITKLFTAEKAPLLFFFTLYIAGISVGSLGQALQRWFPPWQIGLTGTFALLVFIFVFDPTSKFINYVISSGRGTIRTETGGAPKRHKGLIVLCSIGQNISADNAIRYHYKGLEDEEEEPVLQKCWMLTCGKASCDAAKQLIAKLLIEHNIPHSLFEIMEMPGEYADNPSEFYGKVEEIFRSLPKGFEEEDIISDYTGGTKSMTAGLMLACALPSRNLQVLKPNKYKDDGTADRTEGSKPIYVEISFKVKEISNQS